MAIRPLNEANYNSGATLFADGSFVFVQYANDPAFYNPSSGVALTGANLTMAQSIAAGGLPAPIGESPPINWEVTSS